MPNLEHGLTDRMVDVYEESQKNLPVFQKTQTNLVLASQLHDLHFNSYTPVTFASRAVKKVFQKLTYPLLGKQVEFNTAIYAVVADIVNTLSRIERESQGVTIHASINDEEENLKRNGLWFNEPIKVSYGEDGNAYWYKTTERIVEKAYVLQALARLYGERSVTVLDVGAAESLLSYELASLGYNVTATDIRPIPLEHPNLKFVQGDICQPPFEPESFECATALSMLEHIGLGWYGDEVGATLDVIAVQEIYKLLKTGGAFILTVPFGVSAVTPVHRIYDQEALKALIGPFTVQSVQYGVRKDDRTMIIADEDSAARMTHDPQTYLPGAVALVTTIKA